MMQMDISSVEEGDLDRLKLHATELNAGAVASADAWGATFIVEADTVAKTALALGLPKKLSKRLHEKVRSTSTVRRHGTNGVLPEAFTWHHFPTALLLLRGRTPLDEALSQLTDHTLASFVQANAESLRRVMDAQPTSSEHLLFPPQVAARALGVFGAAVSPEEMFELALKYGAVTTEDANGRRAMASRFIMGVALITAAHPPEG
jgi:hypothetical protein